jgi:uncharacterized protein YjiS (DUF1127 family)
MVETLKDIKRVREIASQLDDLGVPRRETEKEAAPG